MKLREYRPLETVAEAERLAKKRLPKPIYISLVAGRERGVTIKTNVDTFDELGFRTRAGRELPAKRDLSTTVMGQELSLPVMISPAGVQAIEPDGEVAVARGAAQVGTAIGLSSFGSKPFEEVVAANPKAFFQLYWIGDRDEITERVERMRRAGAKALIMTVDAMPSQERDWGTPPIPDTIDLATMIRYAPMALSRPAWLARFLRRGMLPDLKAPNLSTPTTPPPTFVGAFERWLATPLPTWDDIMWLRELWGGEFMIKGIITVEDARRAVDVGATAISVSNHGGNNIDSTPSALRALPGIAEAVGDQIEIVYDSGVRRGGDVLKAMALGARAVMIGRGWLFGLAARGDQGVAEVLQLMARGMDTALIGIGKKSVQELNEEDLFIPEGFRV